MITLNLYGLYRIKAKQAKYQFENVANLRSLFDLLKAATDISPEEWKMASIFINGVPIDKLGMFRAKLKDGDVVSVLSPASGG
jgi:molybdopterin converting factor small subunit